MAMNPMSCPVCGSDAAHELTTLSEPGRSYLCRNGHRYVDVNYQPHRYRPPLRYAALTEPSVFTDDSDPTPRLSNFAIGEIHCGPPADRPHVPSPEEIWRSAHDGQCYDLALIPWEDTPCPHPPGGHTVSTEVSIGRAQAPKCYRFHGLRRWRWDAVHYRPTEGQQPGVLDSRVHLDADHGYTFTWIGAALASARAATAREDAP